jgi:hypothetical protein
MSNRPTPEELREAASQRIATRPPESGVGTDSYGISVASLVGSPAPRSYGARGSHRHTIPTVRVSAELAEAVAEFGVANQMNTSDSVRTLIEIGYHAWSETHE